MFVCSSRWEEYSHICLFVAPGGRSTSIYVCLLLQVGGVQPYMFVCSSRWEEYIHICLFVAPGGRSTSIYVCLLLQVGGVQPYMFVCCSRWEEYSQDPWFLCEIADDQWCNQVQDCAFDEAEWCDEAASRMNGTGYSNSYYSSKYNPYYSYYSSNSTYSVDPWYECAIQEDMWCDGNKDCAFDEADWCDDYDWTRYVTVCGNLFIALCVNHQKCFKHHPINSVLLAAE